MAKISLAGFRDPVRRPRFIVWTVVVVLVLAVVIVIALGATSTTWFCAQVCHKVQDDTIRAYEASSHSQISCMACHEPVNADPVTFVIKKAGALGELYLTISNKFSLPLNEGSRLSLSPDEMGSQQCTQCHSSNRPVTPSPGIIIDHRIHAELGIWCTVCHNRTAHNEVASPPVLIDPSGHHNTAHPDYMKMDACFRCHDLQGKKTAPGACSTCHTPDYQLTPASHEATSWATTGHSEAATEMTKAFGEAQADSKAFDAEIVAKGADPGLATHLTTPVFNCYTCHVKATFCDTCHARNKVTANSLPVQ